jgi:hypothetical protein
MVDSLDHKIVGMAFSYAENSMQYRGIQLLSHWVPFYKIYTLADFDIPLMRTNKPNGDSTESVKQFVSAMDEADALVFGIAEMAAQPYSGFKNAMEWLITDINTDKDMSRSYSISNKPLCTTTFTPGAEPAGSRHFEAINKLLWQLNCNIRTNYVWNDAWEHLLPDNVEWVKKQGKEMSEQLSAKTSDVGITQHPKVRTMGTWLHLYDAWDAEWCKHAQKLKDKNVKTTSK